MKTVIFYYGRGCWNWQMIADVSALRAYMNYCAGKGLVQNYKWAERIFQKENLSLRTRKRVKRPSHARIVQAGPDGPDKQWAMYFVSDSLMGGRYTRLLTIVYLWDRSSHALEVDISLSGVRFVRVFEKRRLQGRLPQRYFAIRPWMYGLLNTACR